MCVCVCVFAQFAVQYPGGDNAARTTRRMQFTRPFILIMIRSTCVRQVRAMAATHMALQSPSLSTPQTTLELAAMLRDPNGSWRCPFGTDFEKQSCMGTRMDRGHRISYWLALIEFYSDGDRFSIQSSQHLAYVFENNVTISTTKRLVRRESPQGGPRHLIEVSSDLARA